MQYLDVIRDFAQRTQNICKTYTGPYETTNLINSSLGLFVFPEQTFFNNLSNEMISPELFEQLKSCCTSSYNETLDLRSLCRHIRNGIAHFHLKFNANNHGEIEGITINDTDSRKCPVPHFEITLSVETLKCFFFEFSESIINLKSKRTCKEE